MKILFEQNVLTSRGEGGLLAQTSKTNVATRRTEVVNMTKIAERYNGTVVRRWIFNKGINELESFISEPGTETWNASAANGPVRLNNVDEAAHCVTTGKSVIRVVTTPWRADCLFGAATSDGQNVSVEVSFSATINPEAFVAEFANNVTEDGLDSVVLIDRWINQSNLAVSNEIRKHTLAQLGQPVLLNVWWRNLLSGIIANDRVTMGDVVTVRYACPNAARARVLRQTLAERTFQLALYRLAEDEKAKRLEIDAKHEEERRQIEHNAALSEMDRESKLQEAKNRRIKEQLDSQIEFARKRKELEELERERLAESTQSAERDQKLDAIQARQEETSNQIESLKELLGSIQDQIAEGMKLNPQLMSALSGVSVETIAPLFKNDLKAYFSAYFNERANSDPTKRVDVSIGAAAGTRDVGLRRNGNARKVNSLRIGGEINLSINSPLSGCLTLINLGTSGRLLLMLPNDKARSPYLRRGETLRPFTFTEDGPAGWEEFVAIVTPEPLFETSELHAPNDPDNLITPLSKERMDQVIAALTKLDPNQWTAGVFGMYVDDRR